MRAAGCAMKPCACTLGRQQSARKAAAAAAASADLHGAMCNAANGAFTAVLQQRVGPSRGVGTCGKDVPCPPDRRTAPLQATRQWALRAGSACRCSPAGIASSSQTHLPCPADLQLLGRVLSQVRAVLANLLPLLMPVLVFVIVLGASCSDFRASAKIWRTPLYRRSVIFLLHGFGLLVAVSLPWRRTHPQPQCCSLVRSLGALRRPCCPFNYSQIPAAGLACRTGAPTAAAAAAAATASLPSLASHPSA